MRIRSFIEQCVGKTEGELASLCSKTIGFSVNAVLLLKDWQGISMGVSVGRLYIIQKGNAKKIVKKLKSFAAMEADKEWWVYVETSQGDPMSKDQIQPLPGSVRSFDDVEMSAVVRHVKTYLQTATVQGVLKAARATMSVEPQLRFGQCVFNELPAYITSQIIDTELDMYAESHVGKVESLLRQVAGKFGIPE